MDDLDIQITRLANRGAHAAQENARKNGVPVVYSINGQLIYQMPDGTITSKLKIAKKIKKD
jgi:hypothetical protein